MKAEVNLPSPMDLPDADVVIYDGDCNFCYGQVKRLSKWDGANRLCYISLHEEFVAQQYPELSHEQLMKQIYVINRNTKMAFGGARALRYLSRRLPRLWFAMPFLHIPLTLPLWQWIYNQVAKRRYQIAGKTDCENDACEVHFRQ